MFSNSIYYGLIEPVTYDREKHRWKRKCPTCQKAIYSKYYHASVKSNKNGCNCHPCAAKLCAKQGKNKRKTKHGMLDMYDNVASGLVFTLKDGTVITFEWRKGNCEHCQHPFNVKVPEQWEVFRFYCHGCRLRTHARKVHTREN